MLDKHRKTIRIQNYDYSSVGAYLVTVCTHQRIDYFDNPECVRVCREVWESLPEHHNVKLDQFVIMPDHVHFILWICGKPELGGDFNSDDNREAISLHLEATPSSSIPTILPSLRTIRPLIIE